MRTVLRIIGVSEFVRGCKGASIVVFERLGTQRFTRLCALAFARLSTLAVALLCTMCVPVPDQPTSPALTLIHGGTFVLCEGLWRQDNSVLSYVLADVQTVRDAVQAVNVDTRLGDTATDIIVYGGRMYVVVSASHTIEVFEQSTAKWVGRLRLSSDEEPYRLCIANDTTAYCTNLTDDTITEFNPQTLTIRVARVPVGPAPEGIASNGRNLFVANSGYGDLRASEPLAGTLSVLSVTDLSVVASIDSLPNAATVRCDAPRKRVWVSYRNLVSKPELLGGVALIDASTFKILKRWSFKSPHGLTIDSVTGNAIILHQEGVDEIVHDVPTTRRIISHRSAGGNDVWYGLGFDGAKRIVWVGNARSYVTDGECIAIRLDGTVVGRYAVGANPTAFAF